MNLDNETDLEAACYAVAGFISARARAGRPVPDGVIRLYRKLELAALTAMSDDGRERGWGAEQSNLELIDPEAAAQILGCSARHVRRLARDLDGQCVAGQWVFTRSTVEEYREARHGRRGTRAG